MLSRSYTLQLLLTTLLLSKGFPTATVKLREVGDDARLLSLNFYVLLALFSQLSVFLIVCIIS